jgi:hypothetical protein
MIFLYSSLFESREIKVSLMVNRIFDILNGWLFIKTPFMNFVKMPSMAK